MKSWEREYAKQLNNKWQTRAGRADDDNELDEDELYLLREKKERLMSRGKYQCPNCEVMTDFEDDDLNCSECGWNENNDKHWNDDDLCAA
jgi:ribosomal protein S27AE